VIDRAFAGQYLPLERVNRGANEEIASIELAYENYGSQKARGADFGIQYQKETQFGVFTWLTQATYLDSFQFAEVPTDTEVELRSGVLPGFTSDESYLKWRANSRLDWAWHGFDLATTVHYLDGFHEIRRINRDLPDSKHEHYVKQPGSLTFRLPTILFFPPIETAPCRLLQERSFVGDGKSTENAAAQTASFDCLAGSGFEQHHRHAWLQ
jgi:hypothetical protein